MPCKIIGVGGFLPGEPVLNYDIEKKLNTSHEWILERTGIHQRYFADVTTFDMGYQASLDLFAHYDIRPTSIDLVLVTTCTSDLAFPSIANRLCNALNIKHIPAFDLNAVCSGFLYGLHVASQMIRSESCNRILLVSAEKMSSLLSMNDRKVDILFGDGAGAVVIEKSGDAIFDSLIGSDSNHIDILKTEKYNDGTRQKVTMQGPDVYKYAVQKIADLSRKILVKNNMSSEDIDYFVPHQANARIIESVAEKISIDDSKIIQTVAHHANTSSATIPLALYYLRTKNLLSSKTILSSAVGAGMNYGAAIYQVE